MDESDAPRRLRLIDNERHVGRGRALCLHTGSDASDHDECYDLKTSAGEKHEDVLPRSVGWERFAFWQSDSSRSISATPRGIAKRDGLNKELHINGNLHYTFRSSGVRQSN
jgi:hypothetical protein